MQTDDEIKPVELISIELNQEDLINLRDCFEAGIIFSKRSKYPDDVDRFQRVYKKIYLQVAALKNYL